MFKQPIKVELGTENIAVDHNVTVSPLIAFQAESLIKTAGKTVITVIAVAALSRVSSDVAIHTAKTLIK